MHISLYLTFLLVWFCRSDSEHDQLPAGGGEEAPHGGRPAGEVPTQHDGRPVGGGPGGGPPGDVPRVGRELSEGDAELGDHLDVLRGVEGRPPGRQGQGTRLTSRRRQVVVAEALGVAIE